MEIYALVGRSGTGKSYKAQHVAGIYDIEYILDDGLFIKGTKVVAGVSAKRESTKLAAVRRAIYVYNEHRKEIQEALKLYKPQRLLVIGTSEHMIENIMEALNLGSEYVLVNIEDVSTPDEIETATRARRVKGKHVIPVPTFEIKKDFSGYFVDSVKQLIRRNEKHDEQVEKAVVRPTFSYLGSFEIKDGVLRSIVEASAHETDGVVKVSGVEIENKKEGIIIRIGASFNFKRPIPLIANEMVERVKKNFEFMTGINILEINVIVKSVVF